MHCSDLSCAARSNIWPGGWSHRYRAEKRHPTTVWTPHMKMRITLAVLLTMLVTCAAAQTLSAAQEEELAGNFYSNCIRSFGPDSRLTPRGTQEFCRCSAATFSTNAPPQITALLLQGQHTHASVLDRERATGQYCYRWIVGKQDTLPSGALVKEEQVASPSAISIAPLDLSRAVPSLDGTACTQDASGLVRCSSGLTCTRMAGVLRCNNGLIANTDQGGLTRFSDGSSALTDGGGLTRFSDGTTSQTDSSGLTRFSDGTTCTRDGSGLTRCQTPYGRLK